MGSKRMQRARLAMIQQVVGLAVMVGFAIVSARLLGPAGKGQLTLVTTAGSVASAILGIGIPQALTVWVSRNDLTVNNALTLGLLWTVLVGGATALVIRFMGFHDLTIRLLWFTVSVFLLEQVMSSTAIGAGDMVPPLVSKAVAGGLHVVIFGAAWMVGAHPGIRTAVDWYFGVATFGIGLALALSAIRSSHGTLGLRVDWRTILRETPPVVRFGAKALPAQILMIMNARVDILILGLFAGASAVGIYSLAVSASMLVGVIPLAIGQALTHGFGTEEDPVPALKRGVQTALVAGMAVAVVVATAGWVMVPMVFGPSFAPASLLVAVMVPFTALFSAVQVSYPYFYNHLRRPMTVSAVIGTTAIVDIVLVSLVASKYGALGAAASSAVAYFIGSIINATMTARAAGMSLFELIVPTRQDLAWMVDRARALVVGGAR